VSLALLSDDGLTAVTCFQWRGQWRGSVAVGVATAALLGGFFVDMDAGPKFRLRFTLATFQPWLETALPVGLLLALASLVAAVIADTLGALREPRGRILRMLSTSVRVAVATLYLMANLVAFTRVDDRGKAIQLVQRHTGILWHYALVSYGVASRYSACNSYGLFRRMTGVDARPEVIVEGSMDGKEWHEYTFKYKPGDVFRRPPIVAPHQPRLDWQMWFAALGSIGRNGWLATFAARLLQGSRPVLRLLGPGQPFGGEPPRFVRARLYAYHFAPTSTSLTSPESGCFVAKGIQHQDSTCMCHPTCRACGYSSDPTSASDCVSCSNTTLGLHPVYNDGTGTCTSIVHHNQTAWWTRRLQSEYLHPLALDSEELQGFLVEMGFDKVKKRTASQCQTTACRFVAWVRPKIEGPLESALLPLSIAVATGLLCLASLTSLAVSANSRHTKPTPKHKQS